MLPTLQEAVEHSDMTEELAEILTTDEVDVKREIAGESLTEYKYAESAPDTSSEVASEESTDPEADLPETETSDGITTAETDGGVEPAPLAADLDRGFVDRDPPRSRSRQAGSLLANALNPLENRLLRASETNAFEHGSRLPQREPNTCSHTVSALRTLAVLSSATQQKTSRRSL